MIKFEDLKIGDKIIHEFNGHPHIVEAVGPKKVILFDESPSYQASTIIELEYWSDKWSYYTPPKQKKVKLMSPALITVKIRDFAYCIGTTYDILSGIYLGGLFEDEAEAKKFHGTAFKSWPAKYANGNPIQISVEVEE